MCNNPLQSLHLFKYFLYRFIGNVFPGLKLQNTENNCYLNSDINLLLSSKIYAENQCKSACVLCQFMQILRTKDKKETHSAIRLKTYIAKSHPQFSGSTQEDPSEFLAALISRCKSLQKLTATAKQLSYKCQKCQHTSIAMSGAGQEESGILNASINEGQSNSLESILKTLQRD